MIAQNIVETVTRKGFSLWVTAGKLMVRPKADDVTRELLRQHKAGIISFLSGDNPDEVSTVPENKKSTSFPEISSQDAHREERQDKAGEMPTDPGIVAPCPPNAVISSEDAAGEPSVRDVPCYNCAGRDFWVSIYDVVVCGRCHPPASPGLVARWIKVSGG